MNQPPAVVSGRVRRIASTSRFLEEVRTGRLFVQMPSNHAPTSGDVLRFERALYPETSIDVVVTRVHAGKIPGHSTVWFEPIPQPREVKCLHPGCPSVDGSAHSPECEAAHAQAYIGH